MCWFKVFQSSFLPKSILFPRVSGFAPHIKDVLLTAFRLAIITKGTIFSILVLVCTLGSVNICIAQLLLVYLNDNVVFVAPDFKELGPIDAFVKNKFKFVLRAQLVDDVLALGEVLRRREEGIDGQTQRIFKH